MSKIEKWALDITNDKYRMYGFVPYNLSPIQQGIQFGHGVVEYANQFFDTPDYQEWSQECKTFIILNGGTTNHSFGKDHVRKGTLNQHLETIHKMGIDYAYFCEPDLGDQLTAVVFLVDERVYNKEKYPDYGDDLGIDDFFKKEKYEDWKKQFSQDQYEATKIAELREFLSQFRLA